MFKVTYPAVLGDGFRTVRFVSRVEANAYAEQVRQRLTTWHATRTAEMVTVTEEQTGEGE